MGSETSLMKVEHEVNLERNEMSMIRPMYDFKLKERKKNTELRELLELESVIFVIKMGRLRWFGRVECKGDGD